MSLANFPRLQPKVVLGVAAHPDDLDYGAAGAMAAFANDGAAVHYLILTDGSKGSDKIDVTPDELIKIRQAEQRAAVKAIGGRSVEFLAYPDGELEVTMLLKQDIVRTIRTLKPDVVVTMDPGMLYSARRGFINHPDHRAAGQATLDAVFPLARDHLTFPHLYADGYQPHKTKTILLINFDEGNFAVDIGGTLPTKIAALRAHASQIGDPIAIEKLVTSWAESAGQAAGYTLAESFIRIDVET
ncbi:MAG: PIG-L family deacetylase [Candidatus Saccharimonadales bacterium]